MRNGDKVWYCERISKDGEKLEVFGKPHPAPVSGGLCG